MRRSLALAGLLRIVTVTVTVAGCTPGVSPPAGADGELPAGFPVIEGAAAIAPPADDPGLIAAWTVAAVGTEVYDFYVLALPAAGYPIAGLFPADAAALIRFASSDGKVWQLTLRSDDLVSTRIEVRRDRP